MVKTTMQFLLLLIFIYIVFECLRLLLLSDEKRKARLLMGTVAGETSTAGTCSLWNGVVRDFFFFLLKVKYFKKQEEELQERKLPKEHTKKKRRLDKHKNTSFVSNGKGTRQPKHKKELNKNRPPPG